jgi:tetratricopeptide (TPR) repeat protein
MLKIHQRIYCQFGIAVALCLLSGCMRSPQAREQRFLERGKTALAARDYGRAILEFKNAAQAVKTDAEPYYQLGLVFLDTGDAEKAYQMFYKATELNPKNAAAQAKLAELIATKGSPQLLPQAEKRAKQALAVSPNDTDALTALALLQLRTGKQQDAQSYLQQALDHFPKSLSSSVLLAKVKITSGDLHGAEEVLKQAVQSAPASADPRVALGNFYAASHRIPEAIDMLRSALQLSPLDPLAIVSLAQVEDLAGDKDKAEDLFRRLSTSPDHNYQALYGEYLYGRGKREAALKEFTRLQHEHPGDREARSRLVRAYLAMNRTADAEKVLDQALKQNPQDTDAMIEKGSLFLFQHKYVQAQSLLDQVLHFKADSADAHLLMASVQQARGFPLSARQELGQALRIDPKLLTARLQLTANLLTDSPQAALETLDQAPNTEKRQLSFLVMRNRCLLALGRDRELRAVLDQLLVSFRTPDLLVEDALLRLKTHEYERARASLSEAFDKAPNDPQILDLWAQTYLLEHQTAKAFEVVQKAAAKYSQEARIQQLLGAWLQREGKLKEARAAFLRASAADPNFLDAQVAVAGLDMREHNWDQARKELTGILDRKPDDATARFFLASVEDDSGNYNAAIAHYRKLVAAHSDNALFLNGLAYDLAAHTTRFDEALQYAQKAKELAPEDPHVGDTLGWAYYQKGIYLSAVSQLESAVASRQLTPGEDVARVQYHLAMAYLRSGKLSRGRELLDAALKSDPRLPEANQANDVLHEMAKR